MERSEKLRSLGCEALIDMLACIDQGVGVTDEAPIRIPVSMLDVPMLEAIFEARLRQKLNEAGIPCG